MRIMEQLGFFTALGIVIVFIAAAALGRVASVTSGIRTVETVPETTVPAETAPMDAVPASTGPSLPLRTRFDAVPAKHARAEETKAEETRAVPAKDATPTVG